MRTARSIVLAVLGLIGLGLVIFVVSFASFYYGRYRGFREGQEFARFAQNPSTWSPGVPSAGRPSTNHPAPGGFGEQPHIKGSLPAPAPGPGKPLPNVPGLEMPKIDSNADDLSGQLSQLEGMMDKFMPGAGEEKISPAPEAVALVKKSKDNSSQAIKKYLGEVDQILKASGGFADQGFIGALQEGNDAAVSEAMKKLNENQKSLAKLSVPPRCAELHAYYMTLIPDLGKLMDIRKRAAEEADASLLLEAMGLGRRVMAMQRRIQELERGIKAG